MSTIISPSLLSADFLNLGKDVEMVNQSEAEWIHLDIMDGVLNSLRPAVVAMIAAAGIDILVPAVWDSVSEIALANTDWVMAGIFVLCLVLLKKFRMNPIWVMLLAGVIKVGVSLIV